MLKPVAYFVVWAAASSVCEMLNKSILRQFPYPSTLALSQFTVSASLGLVLMTAQVIPSELNKIRKLPIKTLVPPCICQCLGFLATNYAILQGASSFTQTVKAADPAFNVLLSYLFLGTVPAPSLLFTLVPMIGGVVLCSAAEFSFSLSSLLGASFSNCAFSTRNIFSKDLMSSCANTSAYWALCAISACLCVPIVLLFEVPQMPFAEFSPRLPLLLLANGFFHYVYNSTSYLVLGLVNPLTHSVCNVTRRIAVMASVVIFFGTKLATANLIGMATVFLGAFSYAYIRGKLKAASEAAAATKGTKAS